MAILAVPLFLVEGGKGSGQSVATDTNDLAANNVVESGNQEMTVKDSGVSLKTDASFAGGSTDAKTNGTGSELADVGDDDLSAQQDPAANAGNH